MRACRLDGDESLCRLRVPGEISPRLNFSTVNAAGKFLLGDFDALFVGGPHILNQREALHGVGGLIRSRRITVVFEDVLLEIGGYRLPWLRRKARDQFGICIVGERIVSGAVVVSCVKVEVGERECRIGALDEGVQ